MSIEQEIRNEIDNIKQLKIDVGDINNHLSILEGLCRERNQKAVENAYQRGLDDAWEAARKVALNSNDGGLCIEDLDEIFGCYTLQQVFRQYSAQQTIEKIKAYEEKQKADDEIEVRDEVIAYGCRGVVTYVHENLYTVMMSDGSCGNWGKGELKKTGKKHDIDKIMEALKG